MIGGAPQIMAQQDQPAPGSRRNMDPTQMRQRMMDSYKERLEITSDDEWKVIQGLIEKVQTARMQASSGSFGGFGGGRGQRGGQGGPGGSGAPGAPGGGGAGAGNARPQGMQGMFGVEPLPEIEALQKAVDGKASKEEIKDKLAKLREARKGKQADLEKAQENLKQVLSSRQEAQAVLLGLLQ